MADTPPAHDAIYLDSPEQVDRFLADIAGVRELALDTEGASYHRFVDRIYLLQLSTRDRSAVIDPLPIGTPSGLGKLIESPAVEVVFHDADYDLRLLRQDYGWKVRNVFDTRIAAQLLGLKAFGLAALLERYFGVRLDKKHQRADWSMRPLTRDMLDYAAQDTLYLLELKDILRAELERLGRLSWAKEEFERLEEIQWAPDDATQSFLKLKGARDLTRRELAVLRELVPFRDAVAGAQDRATFRVIGNEQLFAIARLQPVTPDALLAIKGVPRGLVESRGSDLLAAIRRGVECADAQLPRFPKAPRWDRDPDFDSRVSALKTVRDAHAQRLEMDPGVVCSRDRMEAVARRNPASVEEVAAIGELRRWQVEVLGADFVRALDPHRNKPAQASASVSSEEGESPYRE